ncbi:MAG: outer membrane beta-barrel domain-containing protein [Rhodoferax sp.]|nr:outer membrane beta-barrel domain-containing protein [Rhodoferax sp.]
MHSIQIRNYVLGTLLACSGAYAFAAEPSQPSEQVVVPEVARRDIKLPRFPSSDFEIGTFVGTYSTQNFGASAVGGLRLGYHVTEDFFVEGVVAQTKVSDASYRQVLPGGVFPSETETLSYYNLSVGYNILPGEVFIGSKHAKPFSLYVIGGVGSTQINDQRKATFNFGSGMRVYLSDRWALQIDARDHIFSLDLLGKNQSTQNLELTVGITASF